MLLRKRRNQKSTGDRPQFELDFDLSPLEKHFMFWEYLEIGESLDQFKIMFKLNSLASLVPAFWSKKGFISLPAFKKECYLGQVVTRKI